MILLFIITSILYLIMMFFVITLYYTYRKDIEDLLDRIAGFEKKEVKDIYEIKKDFAEYKQNRDEVEIMACKGKGKRKR